MNVFSADSPTASAPASWIAVGSLSVGAFALVTSEFLPVGLLPLIASDLRVSTGEAGLMVTMPGLVAAAAALLSILFAGHINRRRVLAVLLLLLVASNLIVATASTMVQLIAGRILLGIAVGSFWTIAGSLGPRLRPGREGIRASALILSGVSIGTVAGVPAGALIGELFGWRVAFGAAALFAAAAFVALLSLLPSLPAKAGAGLSEIPAIVRDSRARLGLAAAVLIFVGHFAAYTYVAPFLNQRSAIEGGVLSAVLLGNGVAGFFGNMTGGWLSGKGPRLSVITTGVILGGAILVLSVVGSYPILAAASVIVWGFGFGMMPISLQSWMFSAAPDRLEGVQALFVSVAQAALGSGALLGGLVVDHVGITGALLTGATAALATVSLVALLGREVRARASQSAASDPCSACP